MSIDISPASLGSSSPTFGQISAETLAAYAKCITCADYGKLCRGPKLAALGTIANVREFHRRLRTAHKITLREICAATDSEISDYTVKEYFSHEEKDFRWTTVSAIDNALTSICGGFVGSPVAHVPSCPATSSEISAMLSRETSKRQEAESACASLNAALQEQQTKHAATVEQLRNEHRESHVDLRDQVKSLNDEKRYYAKKCDRYSLVVAILSIVCALLSIVSAAYIAWDLSNSLAGFFR
jgi:hypothetical protein